MLPKLLILALSLTAVPAWSCSVAGEISRDKMIASADMIVRATAAAYAIPPAELRFRTTGEPDSVIRFKIVETLRGQQMPEIAMHGYLVQTDDYNDQPVPYGFVRPTGRFGSCFANSYREGAQYLLFLKRTATGELTVNWYALGPVNEQLHPGNDLWLQWVRDHLR